MKLFCIFDSLLITYLPKITRKSRKKELMYVVFNEMIIFITGCPYHHGLQGRHRQQGSDSMIFKTEDVDDMLDIDDAIMF